MQVQIKKEDLRNLSLLFKDINNYVDDLKPKTINKAIDRTNTQAWKLVSAEYTIKKKIFSEYVRKDKASKRKPEGSLLFLRDKRKPTPFFGFKHSVTKKGVKVQIRKDKSVVLFKKAFLANIKNKNGSEHKGIFERKKVGLKRVNRLPIQELYSVTAPQMVDNGESLKKLQEFAGDFYIQEYGRLLDLRSLGKI